jgi:hypothetical protein
MKKTLRFAVASAFAFSLVFGAFSLLTEAEAARCTCPQLYAPVICDNGKTYVNSCYASCAKAKNCVPTGDI